jgi:hypothetical protein
MIYPPSSSLLRDRFPSRSRSAYSPARAQRFNLSPWCWRFFCRFVFCSRINIHILLHAGAYLWRFAVRSGLMYWPAVVGSKRDMPVPMRRRHRIALLLCAASLLTASARPRPLVAGETDEISSTLSSQAVHADSIQPAPPAQPSAAPYQMDQETTEPEPQGAQEYMDANEQEKGLSLQSLTHRPSARHHASAQSRRRLEMTAVKRATSASVT